MDDDARWSDGSSEERELEEERLYSLVHHSSETYENADSVAFEPTDTEVNSRVYSKSSRMNNVQRIIDYADGLNSGSGSMHSGRKSLYINSLSKDLINLPRQSEVIATFWRKNPLHNNHENNTRTNVSDSTNRLPPDCVDKSEKLSKPAGPKSMLPVPNLRNNSGVEKNTQVGLESLNANLLHHNSAAARYPLLDTPARPLNNLFRLDNRLFTNKSANSTGEKLVSVRGKVSRKQRKLDREHRNLEQVTLDVAAADVDVVDVKPVELLKNVIVDDIIALDDYDNLEAKYKMILHSKPPVPRKVANPEIIVLDNDGEESALVSDSDESVLFVPFHAPVTLEIAVEDSSEEEPGKLLVPKELNQPDLNPDHVESSFDFLDSAYDLDGLAQSQARLFSKLISNHSSRESLLDERSFEHWLPAVSCSSRGPDLPHQDANISSSKSPPKQTTETASLVAPSESSFLAPSTVTSLEAPSKSTSGQEDSATFKTPHKKVKKSEFKKVSTKSQKVQRSQAEVSKDAGPMLNLVPTKANGILDYISRRIAVKKAKASDHVAMPMVVEVLSEEEETVEIVDRQRKIEVLVKEILEMVDSGQKRKRKEDVVVKNIVEIVDNETTKRKGDVIVKDIVKKVDSGKKKKRKGADVVKDVVEIVDNKTTKRKGDVIVKDIVKIVDSGKKKKRKGADVVEDIVEIVDNKTTIGRKRKEEDVVEIVEMQRKRKGLDVVQDIVEIVDCGRKRKREDIVEDIMAIHLGSKSRAGIEDIIGEPGDIKRKKELEKARKEVVKQLHLRPHFELTKILGDDYVAVATQSSPPSWTPSMRRFYNDSWGSEDLKTIQQRMSDNPLMWRMSYEDVMPPIITRKSNLNNFNMRSRCRMKTLTCQMCGLQGHMVRRCFNGMCLKCGQPSPTFVKNCNKCRKNNSPDCPNCVYLHNPAKPCKSGTIIDMRSNMGRSRRKLYDSPVHDSRKW